MRFKLKTVPIGTELGFGQNMKVLDLFESYNFREESIFKFFMYFKL